MKPTIANLTCPKIITQDVLEESYATSIITMMDSITVGAKIRMTEAVTGDYPVGSTATILYIDEMDNAFIEWSDGKLSSFSDKQVLKGFEKTGA